MLGGGAGKALSPTLDGFVVPFSLQIDDLPANEQLFCNFIFVATISISAPKPADTQFQTNNLAILRKKKKKYNESSDSIPGKRF